MPSPDRQTACCDDRFNTSKYTERLVNAGIEPLASSIGDSYENTLAETINGFYQFEVINRCGP